jgi:hypothetical protein
MAVQSGRLLSSGRNDSYHAKAGGVGQNGEPPRPCGGARCETGGPPVGSHMPEP